MKMYFLWKRTPHGSIRVSSDGLSGFIRRFLSGKLRCRSVALAEGETASVTLVLSSEDAETRPQIEERLASFAAPLGFRLQIIWTDRAAGVEWSERLSSLHKNPWAWMLTASLIALLSIAGLKGLFWTLFWGTAAWFSSKFLISFAAKKKMGWARL
jgi:hypothetical protein